MADFKPEVDIPLFKVKYSDVYNLKNLYQMMHEYLVENGWRGKERVFKGDTSTEHADIEKMYLEKHCQKGMHKGGKEMWVWWRLVKFPGGKPAGYSEYFDFQLDIDFHMVYTKDIDVMHQGKKITVQKGEIEMFFRPKLVGDIKEHWKKHPILKHFHQVYWERVMSQQVEKKEKELWREAYRLQSTVKQFLNLRTFIPIPESFHHPKYAWEAEPQKSGPMLNQ